jgi:hypothetical protein
LFLPNQPFAANVLNIVMQIFKKASTRVPGRSFYRWLGMATVCGLLVAESNEAQSIRFYTISR